ncbi:hypothetical protein C8C99_3863 [Acidovorax sp. 107]|nr:hypothetical protein C8C99_3863 [Acidovorax sp. 107]
MVHRPLERERQALHGVVTTPAGSSPARPRAASTHASRFVPILLILVAISLLGGIAGGLLRAGWVLSLPFLGGHWLGNGAVSHGALMICGFMGTVIGIERAVAVKRHAAWLAPVASGWGGLCLLAGLTTAGAWLLTVAAVVFVGVNVVVVHRQRAAHTVLLLASALAWLTGSLLFLLRPEDMSSVPWWFAFLVMTIAAERLEMTRLMRRRPGAQVSLWLLLGALAAGAALSAFSARAGGVLYGLSLFCLALWLGVFDIARRTVLAQGLARFMAVCLLGGYAWLAVAGLAWTGAALGLPLRDAALHALGLGFIVSMMMGHAPVILPAIARIKLQFGSLFYVPLAVLHLSLIVRLGIGLNDFAWRGTGALLNAVAIALFAAVMVGAAVLWQARHRSGAPKQDRS